MSYAFRGEIEVKDVDEDAVNKAVYAVMKEQEYDEDEISVIEENVDYSVNRMDCYFDRMDEDTVGTIEGFFCSVTNIIVKLYPDCSMYSHICGTEMSSDTESVYTVKLEDRKIKVLDFDYAVDWVECPNPECGAGVVSWGDFDFDTEYDCDECGRHLTVEDMNKAISEYVEEYDVSEFIKTHCC